MQRDIDSTLVHNWLCIVIGNLVHLYKFSKCDRGLSSMFTGSFYSSMCF